MAQIKSRHQAEEIELDALDPSSLDAEDAPERRLDASAAVGETGVGEGTKILADRIRWQRDSELGHCAQHHCDERVAVWPRPDPIVANLVVAIIANRRPDLWDEGCGLRPAQVDEHARRVAVPVT